MTISRSTRTTRRPRFIGAVVALALITLGACDSSTTTTVPITSAASASPSTTSPPVAATQAPIDDPAAFFQQALSRLTAGYGFTVTAMVGAAVATTVEGRTIAGVSEMTIVSGAATLEYITSPDGQWAREPGGDWAVLEGPAPATDPIATLAAPLAVEVVENGAVVILQGLYPSTVLGLPEGDPIPVRFTVADGFPVAIGYTTAAQGVELAVSTSLAPLQDPTPITIPANVTE